MNIIINDISYELTKTESTENYVEYEVYKNDCLIGYICKAGAEVYYTARDTEDNIRGCRSSIRATLEAMVLDMYYTCKYKGDKYIVSIGAWAEGAKIVVEYVKNDYVKRAIRVVRYDKTAGDLYIVVDNYKYFYYEFE